MGVRSFQTMVPMRDGARLNTFVFLPESGGPRFPVILHRTPYGIAAADASSLSDWSLADRGMERRFALRQPTSEC